MNYAMLQFGYWMVSMMVMDRTGSIGKYTNVIYLYHTHWVHGILESTCLAIILSSEYLHNNLCSHMMDWFKFGVWIHLDWAYVINDFWCSMVSTSFFVELSYCSLHGMIEKIFVTKNIVSNLLYGFIYMGTCWILGAGQEQLPV